MPIYALLVLCVLFWSGNFVIGRSVADDIDPLQLAMFRWLGAAILMSPVVIKSHKVILATIKSHFLILTALSLLGITGFNTLLYIGLQETTATNALLINSSIPVIILVLSYLILQIHITAKQLLGIVFSTLGVVYLIIHGDISSLAQLQPNRGDIWVVTSSIVWALYSVIMRFKPPHLSDFELFATIVYMGLFWLSIIYLSMGYSLVEDILLVERHYMVFLYVSLFTSVLSYYFWNMGIHQIGANKTGQFTHLMPLFGSILAYIFLGERLYMYHIIGAMLIAVGIYLSYRDKP